MDVQKIRSDFPLLQRRIDGKPIVYLDSACQSLRPRQVIDSIRRYYEEYPACAGRSVHKLATAVSIEIDSARDKLAELVNARSRDEICFTKNCTEALNTVISGAGLKRGDAVLTTDREHNSVHAPLLMLKKSAGIKYEIVPSKADETFDLEEFSRMISEVKPKLVAMCHTSNVNGTTIPAREICEVAHDHKSLVLLDGAQHIPYGGTDLQKIDADFYAFSCHKMCGPSGVGVLTGKLERLDELRPLMFGGHGIASADRKSVKLLPPPEKFEAGLQNYSGMIGAGVAAEYISSIGRTEIAAHILGLNRIATDGLSEINSIEMLSPKDFRLRSGICSFNVKGRNPHDVAMMLDQADNIMIRSGMHCAHSWFSDRKIDGSARASFYIYNSEAEAEKLVESTRSMFSI